MCVTVHTRVLSQREGHTHRHMQTKSLRIIQVVKCACMYMYTYTHMHVRHYIRTHTSIQYVRKYFQLH